MSALDNDIKYLKGVGPKRAELLDRELGIRSFADLIHTYPFRYVDRSSYVRIADLNQDVASVQVQATVVSRTLYMADSVPLEDQAHFNKAKRLTVIVDDGSGQMEMVFFRGLKWMYEQLKPGFTFIFFGKPSQYRGRYSMVHPEIDAPREGDISQGVLTGVYPSTEKLRNAGITGKVMCRLENAALTACLPDIKETLPDYITGESGLCSLSYALRNIHFPKDSYALQKAQRRLKFEELFLLQLSLLKQKYIRSRSERGISMPKVGPDFHACYNALPYSLTGAQQRVIKEIRADMLSGHQMNRLLQGDVGSGKTMVAVLSCLIANGNGYQSCLMAPTEVLAQQHYANISRYLEPTKVKCALLTGSSSAKERREIHAGLEEGSISLLIGTHALLEDNVIFKKLGLAIIDEQHRFGVDQRSKLWSKGPVGPDGERLLPHVLVMTATPIPRTLAMTVYGDLDVSVIDEMPPGRKPVRTTLHTPARLPAVYEFMRQEIAKGRQVFVIYPMIYENEKLDLSNLEAGYEDIMREFPLPEYKTAIVHGQQTPEVKNFNMEAFAAGRADILVSTTVVEVGVDVPNASVMVIMSAQRFGLSQLHQLRGRVGRGSASSHCILIRDYKTSKEALQRLQLMCKTEDGFEIAEEDMKMRGPGDLEGTLQSGLPIELNIASLAKDGLILGEARALAQKVLSEDPTISADKNKLLAEELRKDKYRHRDYSKIS